MTEFDKIERAIRILDAKVARLRQDADNRRIQAKVNGLKDFAFSDEATKEQKRNIRASLKALDLKVAKMNPTLEDIEKEVDRIYGDQSVNSTYYFSRKNVKNASDSDGKKELAHQILEGIQLSKVSVKTRGYAEGLDDLGRTLDSIMANPNISSLGIESKLKKISRELLDRYESLDDLAYLYFDTEEALGNIAIALQRQRFSNQKQAAFLRESEAKEVNWGMMSLEEIQKMMDSLYGDQSKNKTFYLKKAETLIDLVQPVLDKKSDMSLKDIMDQMDRLYGDQSKNETFYPSRRFDDNQLGDMVSIADEDDRTFETEAGWQTQEEHYLQGTDWEDKQLPKVGDADPGYFSTLDFPEHNVVAPTYRVDNGVATPGYHAEETIEMPHVIEDTDNAKARPIRAGVGVFDMFRVALTRADALGGRGVELEREGDILRGSYLDPSIAKSAWELDPDDERRIKAKFQHLERMPGVSEVYIYLEEKSYIAVDVYLTSDKVSAVQAKEEAHVVGAFLHRSKEAGTLLKTDGLRLASAQGHVFAEWIQGRVELSDEPQYKKATDRLKKIIPAKYLS